MTIIIFLIIYKPIYLGVAVPGGEDERGKVVEGVQLVHRRPRIQQKVADLQDAAVGGPHERGVPEIG